MTVVQCHGDSGVGQDNVCGCRVLSWREWCKAGKCLWLPCNVMVILV